MAQTPADPPSTVGCTDASSPFDQSSADVVLRTCDNVNFRVHSPILAQASPFFSDMFSLPQPPRQEILGARGVGAVIPDAIPVSEDSGTLDLLLRILYPIPKPSMEEPGPLVPVLKAAKKYDMAWPVVILSERLTATMSREPLQVWAAACRAGLEYVARGAAVALRNTPMRNALIGNNRQEALTGIESLGDMEGISAGDYFRLKQFLEAQDDVEHIAVLKVERATGSRKAHRHPVSFTTNLPSTDVICRTSSNAGDLEPFRDFHAHRAVLSIHSSVLDTRLAELAEKEQSDLAGDPTRRQQPKLVLEFDEPPEVVATLLRYCYGGYNNAASLKLITQTLAVSYKYAMAQITPQIRMAWDHEADKDPLHAYFTAVHHGLRDCARAAASGLRTGPVAKAMEYNITMETAPSLTYHRLLVYHDSCSSVMRDILTRERIGIPGLVGWRVRQAFRSDPSFSDTQGLTGGLETLGTSGTRGSSSDLRSQIQELLIRQVDNPGHNSNYPWSNSDSRLFIRSLLRLANEVPGEIDAACKAVCISGNIRFL
ncbi:hypothetical protein C8Q79DRAFT_917530 [Trametes meyenii]|nr:hypothetical protein C8Q79DRAFT_917530 [Trametes meyenii]